MMTFDDFTCEISCEEYYSEQGWRWDVPNDETEAF